MRGTAGPWLDHAHTRPGVGAGPRHAAELLLDFVRDVGICSTSDSSYATGRYP
jgi:hypothetical protein